jgi:hypothetical protein
LDCPNGTSDCPAGQVCLVDSCCIRPVCVPTSLGASCNESGAAPRSARVAGGQTTAGAGTTAGV